MWKISQDVWINPALITDVIDFPRVDELRIRFGRNDYTVTLKGENREKALIFLDYSTKELA